MIPDRPSVDVQFGDTSYQDDLALRLSGDSTKRAFAFSALILAFNIWDHFVDPDHAMAALWWRLATACAILLVQGLWVVSKRKSYTLYRRLVLIHTVTVPFGMTAAVAMLNDGLLYGLSNFVFIYLWIPSVLPVRRDAALGGLLSMATILGVTLYFDHRGLTVGNIAMLALLGIVLAMATATKFEAALRRAWRQEQIALQEARTDSLTGAVNRRHFAEAAAAEWGRSIRYARPASLILFDLDRFKQINDDYGHAVGDQVLRQVAEACQYEIRDIDLLARIGGEEFAVLVPETPQDGALGLAERLRVSIAALSIATPRGPLHPTASFGVAPLTLEGHDWTEALDLADGALYRAKENGRNRVEAAILPG
jgi:diguanylate cyclase (GGDEF)-like protein